MKMNFSYNNGIHCLREGFLSEGEGFLSEDLMEMNFYVMLVPRLLMHMLDRLDKTNSSFVCLA